MRNYVFVVDDGKVGLSKFWFNSQGNGHFKGTSGKGSDAVVDCTIQFHSSN